MKRITGDQLQSWLSPSSKNRLKIFRTNLKADREFRNFDHGIDAEISKYLKSTFNYGETKKYLKNLRSSKDGKLFSQGVKEYSLMLDGLMRFAEPNYPSFQWNQNYQSAKAELVDLFSSCKLSELVYCCDADIIDALPKSDTHSGFNFILTGLKEKGKNFDNIFRNYCKEEQRALECGSFNKPILPGCRTQGSGAFDEFGNPTFDCKHKTRVISMIDMYVIIGELKFAKPIQNAMATMSLYAGGKDERGISKVVMSMRSRYQNFISLDYSAFDQSISDWLIYDAFDIIRSAFSGTFSDDLFAVVKEDFIHKNFITHDGVISSRKGVPSGSMFTQIIDSIVNILMVRTYLKSIGSSGDMIVMGDDNLLYTPFYVDPKHIASYITKNFGVVVNSDKTTWGSNPEDPEFLSRVWRSDGQWREPHIVISKMLYPERKRDYSNGKVDAALVLYAYILTYNLTMPRIMDVDRFMMDHPKLRRSMVYEEVDSRYLPGGLAYIRDYTRTKDAA